MKELYRVELLKDCEEVGRTYYFETLEELWESVLKGYIYGAGDVFDEVYVSFKGCEEYFCDKALTSILNRYYTERLSKNDNK